MSCRRLRDSLKLGNLIAALLVLVGVVDVYVLEVHVRSEELPWVHRSVEREAEWFSVEYVLAEDRQFHIRHLGLIEWAHIEEHLVAHTLGFALGQSQTFGVAEELLVVGEGFAAAHGLLQFLVVQVAGHHIGHGVDGVGATAFDSVRTLSHCNQKGKRESAYITRENEEKEQNRSP